MRRLFPEFIRVANIKVWAVPTQMMIRITPAMITSGIVNPELESNFAFSDLILHSRNDNVIVDRVAYTRVSTKSGIGEVEIHITSRRANQINRSGRRDDHYLG